MSVCSDLTVLFGGFLNGFKYLDCRPELCVTGSAAAAAPTASLISSQITIKTTLTNLRTQHCTCLFTLGPGKLTGIVHYFGTFCR